MSSMTKGREHGSESMLFQDGPAVWSHPDEPSLMEQAWRDQQAQKRRTTTLVPTPMPSEAKLEDAVVFVQSPEPKSAASNIVRLVQPVDRVRPGKSADGDPLTKEYFFRVFSTDADWLRDLQSNWPIVLPKLVLGIGLGWWSLPWHRMKLPAVSTSKKKVTVSIHIRNDQWVHLCANASQANPQNPDPVRYCMEATLGRVRVPKPGPVLLTVREEQVMQCVLAAAQLGHRTNLLSRFHPDTNRLERAVAELHARIEKNGVGVEDAEQVPKLQALLGQLQRKANLCASATEEWREFFVTVANIAVPKKQNPVGAK